MMDNIKNLRIGMTDSSGLIHDLGPIAEIDITPDPVMPGDYSWLTDCTDSVAIAGKVVMQRIEDRIYRHVWDEDMVEQVIDETTPDMETFLTY